MESLLRWSIENSTPQDGSSATPVEGRKNLDPEIIDHILGKPDAVQMKDDMAVALDVSKSESERVEALDDLELLIEHIDNANDLHKLGLWEPLHGLVTAEKSTPDIQVHALWVIGTAVQHNPAAQDVYLSLKPLPALVSLLDASRCSSNAVRAKVLYVLSGLLRHNAHAVKNFGIPEVNGWPKLRHSLQDPDISIRRKAVFIMATLLKSNCVSDLHRPSHGNTSASTSSNVASTNLMAADNRTVHPESAPAEPVHPNSHAANLRDPSRLATSELTLDALRKHHIVEDVVDSIVNPLPHGEDGDFIGADLDYVAKAMGLVYPYVVTCSAELANQQKKSLSEYLRNSEKKHDMAYHLDRLGLSSQEYNSLLERVSPRS